MSKPDMEKRKGLTKDVLLWWIRRYTKCAICDDDLFNGYHDDHIKPLSMGGTNDPINRQPLCPKCHLIKTKEEAAPRAKADRQAGRTGQQARRKKAKAKGTYKGIQSQGFSKTHKKKFDGTVEKIK